MKMKIWYCKIGEIEEHDLSDGADEPMRKAVERAYQELTGRDSNFCFSGWGAELDKAESATLRLFKKGLEGNE